MNTLKNIEMMNDLLIKSKEIMETQKKDVYEHKIQLLLKAKAKIQKYFSEVLEVLPFPSINVTIESTNTFIMLRRERSDVDKKHDLSYGGSTIAVISLNKSSYSSNYFTIQDEYKDKYWGQSKLYGLNEPSIIKIVENFDLIKKEVEESINKQIQKNIEENAKVVKKEADNLDVLTNFLG
jgi:hypothetical protein